MNTHDLISSSTAAQLAKINESTLQRFAEAGYLHPKKEPSGEIYFSKMEVAKLFGFDLPLQIEVERKPSRPVAAYWPENSLDNEDEAAPAIISASVDPNSVRQPFEVEPQEMMRLKTLAELQERLIEVQASQINQLQSERDWLRERVERLETKSDRDQGLILSKTQTIERLVSLMSQRRSPFAAVLEFLGFQPNAQQSPNLNALEHNQTIEMKK